MMCMRIMRSRADRSNSRDWDGDRNRSTDTTTDMRKMITRMMLL